MQLSYNDITIKKRFLIYGGFLDIKPNTINVIHGRNGCGKTLLLNNIQSINNEKNIAIMSQNSNMLFNKLNVIQNISMCDDLERQKIIKNLVKELGLEKLLSRKVSKLSGGEARIVNALRAA